MQLVPPLLNPGPSYDGRDSQDSSVVPISSDSSGSLVTRAISMIHKQSAGFWPTHSATLKFLHRPKSHASNASESILIRTNSTNFCFTPLVNEVHFRLPNFASAEVSSNGKEGILWSVKSKSSESNSMNASGSSLLWVCR